MGGKKSDSFELDVHTQLYGNRQELQKAVNKKQLMTDFPADARLCKDCTHVQTDQGGCKRCGLNNLISCQPKSFRDKCKIQDVKATIDSMIAYYTEQIARLEARCG